MGLDVVVYCDCFEQNHLQSPPKPEWLPRIGKDGSRESGATEIDLVLAFDEWSFYHACEHENGILLHHYLGNIATIGKLNILLEEYKIQLPVLLEKVLYSGTHCGDFLAVEKIYQLKHEIDFLSTVHAENLHDEQILRYFEQQMKEVIECALSVKKPICF